jgi:hypothetical protein
MIWHRPAPRADYKGDGPGSKTTLINLIGIGRTAEAYDRVAPSRRSVPLSVPIGSGQDAADFEQRCPGIKGRFWCHL